MRYRLITILVLLATAATAQKPPDFAAARQATVEHLTQLVRIDTSNPPGNETSAAQYIKKVLDREGIPSQIVESAPGRGSIIARLRGNGSRKPLLLLGHLDVVGVERERWSVAPFAALVQNGFLYGRGAADDKAMVAANLEVFLLLHRRKVALDRDVIFLAEAGEEGTTEFGIDFLVEKHWDKIACEYAINEGGDFLLGPDGRLKIAGIATIEKLPRGLRVVARGSSGHGSMPRVDNPIVHLAEVIARIGQWQPPMRLNETTREMFARLAKISPPAQAYLYTHLSNPKVQETLRRTDIRVNSVLRTSISPNIIRGGFRENVIPAEAEAILDVRALPGEDMTALIAMLKKLVNDPAIEITPLREGQRRPEAPASRRDSELYLALERAQAEVYPGAATLPIMQVGATDSAQLRAKGVQAYGVSIPKTDEETWRVHGNDERVSVEALGSFVRYLYAVTLDVAAAK